MEQGMDKAKGVSRRDFIRSGLLGAAGLAAAGSFTACAPDKPAVESPEWLPTNWEAEADIIVIGFGAAGAAAAITAAQEGLGEVLVLETAPEGFEGGNSGVCGQLVLCPPDKDKLVAYQQALNGEYVVEESLIKAWADEMVKNVEWLSDLGADMQQSTICAPEYPEYDEGYDVQTFTNGGVTGKRAMWTTIKEASLQYDVKVLYDTRAQRLIQNPMTKEVLGVIALDDAGGNPRSFKARKGVVLACGGFENNQEMVRDYITSGMPDLGFKGTPYNRGDGVIMAEQVGAKLWHMGSYASTTPHVRPNPDDHIAMPFSFKNNNKDYIYVGPDAKRIKYEETFYLQRHGKIVESNTWCDQIIPSPTYAIFTSTSFDGDPILDANAVTGWVTCLDLERPKINQEGLASGCMFEANSIKELAEKIGLNPDDLQETIDTYNGYCANGADPEFHRGESVLDTFAGTGVGAGQSSEEKKEVIKPFELVPITGSKYYALRLCPVFVNTQGGPKRSAKGEVVDVDGMPIPRLYAAGELGTIYAYLYNGGGNFAEAMSAGRIAVRNAAALDPWEV